MNNGRILRRLFLTEASLAGKIVHPHIVEIYDATASEDSAYIVMEYVGGGTLQRLTSSDSLPGLGDVIEIIYKCSRALDYASRLGVIHRGIKPANILIREGTDIKITDFGSAALPPAACRGHRWACSKPGNSTRCARCRSSALSCASWSSV